jgi:hypothetical protein
MKEKSYLMKTIGYVDSHITLSLTKEHIGIILYSSLCKRLHGLFLTLKFPFIVFL